MFQNILDNALTNINTFRLVLQTNEKLRKVLSETTDPNLISMLLTDLLKKKSRFKKPGFLEDIAQNFSFCTTDVDSYKLVAEAFIVDHPNLRSEALNTILINAGILHEAKISSVWTWIVKYRNVRQDEKIVTDRLDKFVEYRNDAAHRNTVDSIFESTDLIDLCNFIESLCQALAELARFAVINKKISNKKVKKIGKTTNWLSKQEVLCANICQPPLSIGDEIFLLSSTKSYCKSAKIEEIKNDKEVSVKIIEEKGDYSFKLDTDARKGLDMYIATPDINEESDIDLEICMEEIK
ncbi:MAG: hypothetical protein J7647_00870 [Cyanobacteria bacterium SBLK]|nr:hypothetical protein [Cyanobacteria bacterium SBLK]